MKLEKYKKVGTQDDAYYFVTATEMSGKSEFTIRWHGFFSNDSHCSALDAVRFRFWVRPKEPKNEVDPVTITFHDINEPFGKGEFEATLSLEDLRRLRDAINEILAESEAAVEGKHAELDEKYRSTSIPSGRLMELYGNPRFL